MGVAIGHLFNWHTFVTQLYGDKYWKVFKLYQKF